MRSKYMQRCSRARNARRRLISPQGQRIADSPDRRPDATQSAETPSAITTLPDTTFDDLMDLCGAEARIVDALSVLASVSSAATVKTALNAHLDQARAHLRLLTSLLEPPASVRSHESVLASQSVAASTIPSPELVSDRPRPVTLPQRSKHCEHPANGSLIMFGWPPGADERAAQQMAALLDGSALGTAVREQCVASPPSHPSELSRSAADHDQPLRARDTT